MVFLRVHRRLKPRRGGARSLVWFGLHSLSGLPIRGEPIDVGVCVLSVHPLAAEEDIIAQLEDAILFALNVDGYLLATVADMEVTRLGSMKPGG